MKILIKNEYSRVLGNLSMYENIILTEIIDANVGSKIDYIPDNYIKSDNIPGPSFIEHNLTGIDFDIKLSNDKMLNVKYHRNNNYFERCPKFIFNYDGMDIMNCYGRLHYHPFDKEYQIELDIYDAYFRENSRFTEEKLKKTFFFFLDEINKYVDIVVENMKQQELLKDKKFDELLTLI